ncbi:MAG: helix-turn-helix domain-containing protein [Pseudomonadota bacterium]
MAKRRSQADRRAETRAALKAAARALLLEKGYDATSTPEIATRAGVTRGALYHHFSDKQDLYRALALDESRAVAAYIEDQTRDPSDPHQALEIGTRAYLDAMAYAGRAQLLLADAPSILGFDEALALSAHQGSAELRAGLAQAMPNATREELDALTQILSAAFDRAALEIASGGNRTTFENALLGLLRKAMG